MKRALRFTVACAGAISLSVVASVAGAAVPSGAPAQTPTGTLRLAAEGEPSCADWISSCAGSAWGQWTLGNQTLPQALVVSAEGDYVPGAMLVDAPTLQPGPPMRVTYRIRPDAVWSDGTPITSKDFEYTWKQITTGKDIYDPTGYTAIASIDTTDPKIAVVTFSETYAPWRDLFGGSYYVLPRHLLDGKNRNKVMRDGYEFSGGPWRLEGGKAGWKQGSTITLVPNDRFWGTKPKISKVVFQFTPESAAQFQAVKTGQVAAAYPLPQDGIVEQLSAQSNLAVTVSYGNAFEALFLNTQAFPLDRAAVRQAVTYATDRNAIVEQVLRPSIGQGRVLQSLVVPTFRQYFTPAFQGYVRNLATVDQLMTGDGWAKQGGVWTKNGRKASLTITTTAGDQARELTEQLWQSQLRQAGFEVKIKNQSANVLFGKTLFGGNYSVVLAQLVGTPDPGLCTFFCSSNIPTKQNDFSGMNVTRTSSPSIDAAWKTVDGELDLAKRIAAAQAGQQALAQEVPTIPLYQAASIFVYDKSRIGGRVEDNTVMGPFFTMNEWVLK